MCTIIWSVDPTSVFPFVLTANRDEFLAREASPMHWQNDGRILAGRDLEAGGMWLGLNRNGQFAALTNVRDLKNIKPKARSRGDIVPNWIGNNFSPQIYQSLLTKDASVYNGYNLVFGSLSQLNFQSNYKGPRGPISPGIHGLSNATLNTGWPKVNYGKSALGQAIEAEISVDGMLANCRQFMSSQHEAEDNLLPETGIGLEWERKLSALNIRHENYGTRVTTTIVMTRNGQVFVEEYNQVNAELVSENFTLQT